MDVVSLCPLRVGSLVWQPRRGTWVLTAVCKATYSLQPAESPLAQEQEYPNEDDNHWNDDPARSLYSPADLVPFKPRADVMLVGHAFAARKDAVRSLIARLIVGEVNKAVEVWCDRSWTQDGSLREGPRFLKMPLRYERAAGGPETANPVGVRLDARPDAYGSLPVPNLQPTGLALASSKDFIEPICFGPVAWTWPARRARLARHAGSWEPAAWSQQPIPEDIDPGFFNAAPRDQQVDSLRPNERLILENLHPEHARLATNLPGKTPRAFVERRGAAPQEVQLICDTLWIDTDRAICTLTWRAQIPLEHPSQPGRVLIALAEPGQRLAWADVERLAASIKPEDGDPDTMGPGRAKAGPTGYAEPPPLPQPPPPQPPPQGPRQVSTLPFVVSSPEPTGPPAEAPKPRISRPRSGDPMGQTHDEVMAYSPAPTGAALPFGAAAAPPPRRSAEPPAAAGAGAGAPPWLTQSRASAPPAAPAPPLPGSPFGSTPPAPPPMYAPPPIQPPAATAFSPAPPDAPSSNGKAPPAAPGLVPPPAAPAGASLNLGPLAQPPPQHLGLALQSAPAAPQLPAPVAPMMAPTPRASGASAGTRAREVIDLLWFDPEALPRIRAHAEWKPLLEDGGSWAAAPPEQRDRRDVSAVLARGDSIEPDWVGDAVLDAVAEDGSFLPPLVLTGGELIFPFDALATLRATVAVVKPFVGNDKKLGEAVDAAAELLAGDALASGAGIAGGLAGRIREAFQPQSRTVPAGYLDAQTERMLLEQRRYQKRTMFGASWLRATLAPGTGGDGVPAYLPEELGKRLPMFQRFGARLIAEAHLQQDQYETSPTALKVVAVARVMPIGGRSDRRG